MFTTIIMHELKNIMFSPKFSLTFSIASLLMLVSVLLGIRQYEAARGQYETTTTLAQQEMRESRSWMSMRNKVLRVPDPLHIFVSGVNHDVGRMSSISNFAGIKLTHSTYTDDPIYAVFRFIDFSFIVTVVFSLLALLFTYDAVNGEVERGTLQLTFSNAVPRGLYILAKFLGSLAGMLIPLLIPMLLSVLALLLWNIPLSADQWLGIGALFLFSFLYIAFFAAFGILMSTLTKRSSVSFLFALVAWICFVFIIPRSGTTIAGQVVRVPTVAESEAQSDAFAKDRWKAYESVMEEKWKQRNAPTEEMSKEERERYRDDNMWTWMEEDDRDRKQVQKDIDKFTIAVQENVRNAKQEQERLGLSLSRVSPASSFLLAAMHLSGSDIAVKTRYEDALNTYRTLFNEYKEKKQKGSGDHGGIRITFDSDSGLKIDTQRDKGVLDISDAPAFDAPQHSFREGVASAAIDFGLLGLFTLAAFAGAFVRFLRYDVR